MLDRFRTHLFVALPRRYVHWRSLVISVLVTLSSCHLVPLSFAATPQRKPVTPQEITHLMLLHCTVCHGGRTREAGLDLRTRTAMLKGGKSGPALVPGHPEQSLILKKVQAGKMPPFEQMMQVSVKPFSASEIDRISQWIALGAPEVQTDPDVATT